MSPPQAAGAREDEHGSSAALDAFRAKWSAADLEDEPPPLESLPEQLQALRVGAARAVPVTPAAAAQAAAAKVPPASSGVRRGFFDAPRTKAAKARTGGRSCVYALCVRLTPLAPAVAQSTPEMLILKDKPKTEPSIPECFKVRAHCY